MEPGKTRATARNQRYKLHLNGDFYDIKNDKMEVKPLDMKTLSPKQVQIFERLQNVLDHYAQFDTLENYIESDATK